MPLRVGAGGGHKLALLSLLVPFPAERMRAVAVSTRVNSTRNDDPDCITPAA